MPEKNTLTWDEIKDKASSLFNVWAGCPKLVWAHKAWNGLVKQGLADYTSDIEYHEVLLRLTTLADMYDEFCEKAYDEYYERDYDYWIDTLDINLIRIGQLIGKNFETEINDPYELIKLTFQELIYRSKRKIFDSLCKEFGDESTLFVALWITPIDLVNKEKNNNLIEDENNNHFDNGKITESDDIKKYEKNIEDLAEDILDNDIYDVMEAYQWVTLDDMY